MTRIALLDAKPLAENCYTFGGLDYLSDKFAATLHACGIREGDAVAVVLGPSAALVIAELGALKLGAVVVPLAPALALSDAELAINDCTATALIVPFDRKADYAALACRAASIKVTFVAGDSRDAIHYEGAERSFWRDVFLAPADFAAAATEASAPAFIFYARTAEGSLRPLTHSHAAILGQLAQISQSNEQQLEADNALECGGDWASAEVLLGLVFPTWWNGGAVMTGPKRG